MDSTRRTGAAAKIPAMSHSARFAVLGLGGAGGYFGARLVEAGHEVAFIARGEHLAEIRRAGLRVESPLGDVVARPAAATDDPRAIGPVPYVLLGVKTWQVPEAARAAAPLIGPATAVLPLQNGVEAPDQIAEALGREHALGGTARIISFIAGPGHVRHAGAAPAIELGELDDTLSPRAAALRDALAGCKGLTATIPADIRAAMWAKLMFISPLAGVGAVTRVPIGVLRAVPETRRLLARAIDEVEGVARARGIALPEDVAARTMSYVDAMPAGGTASMQRDIADGKPSELESLPGAVCRLGAAAGVPTPVHDFLRAALLPLELAARGPLPR